MGKSPIPRFHEYIECVVAQHWRHRSSRVEAFGCPKVWRRWPSGPSSIKVSEVSWGISPKSQNCLVVSKIFYFPQPDWGWWSNLTNSYFSRWLKPPSSHNVWQFWRKRWGKWGRSITLHPYDQKWLVAQGLLTQCCQLVKVEFVEPPSSLGLRQ